MDRKKIYISEFGSEDRLKGKESFSLPSAAFFKKNDSDLLQGMDALTATMAEEGSILITQKKLPKEYFSYWCDNVCRLENLSPDPSLLGENVSVYSALSADESLYGVLRNAEIVNYALTPDYYRFCEALSIPKENISLSTIGRINRKSYSNGLKYKFDLPCKGITVLSEDEFEDAARKILETGRKVLVKDSLGVSGRGIVILENLLQAQRLVSHFKKQRDKGRTDFDFVLEPLLNRTMDFSCQFHIGADGKIFIDGYQKNSSRGFAYTGTTSLSHEEHELIMSQGYSGTVEKIAGQMYRDGYYGFACIDSMIADGTEVIPLVEINPRMSMARFNLNMEKRIGTDCSLWYTETVIPYGYGVEDLLCGLDRKKALYHVSQESGIIPLAPCTWDTGERVDAEGRPARHRLYFISVGSDVEALRLKSETEQLLTAISGE